jgi:hypothetical protein
MCVYVCVCAYDRGHKCLFVFEILPFQQTKLSDEISAFERRVIALQTARDELHTRATQAKHDYEGLLHKSAQECVQVQEWWHQEKLARLAAEDECRVLSVRALLCTRLSRDVSRSNSNMHCVCLFFDG